MNLLLTEEIAVVCQYHPSRVNRVTRLAPDKDTKQQVPHFVSLAGDQSTKFVSKP